MKLTFFFVYTFVTLSSLVGLSLLQLRVIDCPALLKNAVEGAGYGCEAVKDNAGTSDVILLVLRAFDGTNATQVRENNPSTNG